jgi:GT2 family glycosyltransferase/SAM-dependent methyltransferase/glycosyltransferase involved in cell wall biosynthesis
MTKTALSAFTRRTGDRIWTSPTCKDFSYSDGDAAELRMHSIVSNATDLSLFSRELRDAIVDWPTEYHLSARRANIIRPLTELGPGVRVLELGCGCGAVTRALAETGAEVDAVEGSPRRASIAAERVRDLDNARVHVSNFQDIEFEQKYDIVTLIGVLEYAPVYIDSQNPFVSCLEMAKSALKPGGKLVIAIENRLGLKYFSGISEDHFSIPYYGIEGRYQSRQITTYGKKRLSAFLREAGLPAHEFLYPFPDYKLPEVILTENGINHPDFNCADLVSQLESRDYSMVGTAHFDLGLAWESVAEEGLLGELSNSFLVIACQDALPPSQRSEILALKFTDNRHPAFTTQLAFRNRNEVFSTDRTPLCPAASKQTRIAHFSPIEEPYIPGHNVFTRLKRALICGDQPAFKALLQKWIHFLQQAPIDSRWLDAVPPNVILDRDDELQFIDREWDSLFTFDWPLPAERGLVILRSDPTIASLIQGESEMDKLFELHRIAGLELSESIYLQALQTNRSLWDEIFDNGTWKRDWRTISRPGECPRPEAVAGEDMNSVSYEQAIHSYHGWLDLHQPEAGQLQQSAEQQDCVRFIVVLDATEASPEQLARTLTSFAQQQYNAVQLVVTSPIPAPEQNPPRILWLESAVFPNILLLELAKANPEAWLILIRAGDCFSKSGMYFLAKALQNRVAAALSYADGDTLDSRHGPAEPQFRPDFDIDHLRSFPYIGRFLVMRGHEYAELGGLNESHGCARFYDYSLRVFEQYGDQSIFHLTEILFHGIPDAQTQDSQDLHHQVLIEHLARQGIDAESIAGAYPGSFQVSYRHHGTPLVSIIIPTKDKPELLQCCLESILEKTAYKHYEILIVDNQSSDPEAIRYLDGLRALNTESIRVLSYPHPFNFSAMNNMAAMEAHGEYLVQLNNDTAIIHPDWLDELLNHAQRPEVGIVGAKLLFPTGEIQHAGVLLGLHGLADHPFIGEAMDAPGYFGRLLLDQQYSAVTAACLMIRKSIYQQVGGMDEVLFKVLFNDVDLCLKVREENYSVVWASRAIVMHIGSVSQKEVDQTVFKEKKARVDFEHKSMYQKWLKKLIADPFYNKNLSLSGNGFELEMDPIFCRFSDDGRPRILAHPGDAQGSGSYRIIEPLRALVASGFANGDFREHFFDPVHFTRFSPDVVVLQRQHLDGQILTIKNYREFGSARLIYDIDDNLAALPRTNPNWDKFPEDILERLGRVAKLCDRITVSTAALKRTLSDLHPDIVVQPNYLPPARWGEIVRRSRSEQSGKPRIGWAGGLSHAADLELIAAVVKALADKVDWVFFGMKPEGVDSCIAEYHPGVAIDLYPERLAGLNLDLALAPLEISPFNVCKSNLRLLEYGACGYPVIATDIEPYRGDLPVTLVRNNAQDWIAAIEAKLSDPEALRLEGLALQAGVRENWMLEGENLARLQQSWTLDQDKR